MTIGDNPLGTVEDLFDRIAEESSGKHDPIVPGYPGLAAATGGMRPGEITVIAGGEGGGKSYYLMNLLLSAHNSGVSWQYMPLEDTARDALARMVGINANTWAMTEMGRQTAVRRMETLREHYTLASSLSSHIAANPRNIGRDGSTPDLPWGDVIAYISEASKRNRIIAVDPITMIDFDRETAGDRARTEWEGQQAFVKRAAAIVSATDCHLIMVLHLTKDGAAIQGSTAFTRFVHNVFIWRAHDTENNMVSQNGMRSCIDHRRTLDVRKVRNGRGAGLRLAYDFYERGPCICEHGVIIKESR